MRVPLNGWVFIYEIGGCGFKSCCSHLIHLISKLDYNYAKFDRNVQIFFPEICNLETLMGKDFTLLIQWNILV